MAGVKSVVCAAAALAAGFAFAEDPYIESDGNEGFDTGYCFGRTRRSSWTAS